MIGLVECAALLVLDRYNALALDRAVTTQNVDFVLLHQEVDTLAHCLGHATTACHDLRDVSLRLTLDIYAVCGGILNVMIYRRTLQKRLCRDTTPIQAYATQRLALDDCGAFSGLCGTYGCYVATRAATDNNNVVFHCLIVCFVRLL